MNIRKHILAVSGFAFLGFVVLSPTVQADATIERFTHFNELTGIAAHDSTTTDYIQGNRKREENLRKFTGAVLGAWQHFRHEDKGAKSVDIYDINNNKHYDLNADDKTYSVEPIYTPEKPTETKASSGSESGRQQEQSDKNTRITKNELTVKATGKTKNINGFETAEYVVTWDVETENTKTGEKGKSLMTADMWNSTDANLAKAHAEEAAYEKAYLKLMRVPATPDEAQVYGFGTMRINSADQKQFFDKLHTIKGYPVSLDVTWQTAGTDKNGKSESEQNQAHESLDSAIGGLFGAKSKTEDKPKVASNGMATIFSSHIEIKSVKIGKLDKALFEVPKDYHAD